MLLYADFFEVSKSENVWHQLHTRVSYFTARERISEEIEAKNLCTYNKKGTNTSRAIIDSNAKLCLPESMTKCLAMYETNSCR